MKTCIYTTRSGNQLSERRSGVPPLFPGNSKRQDASSTSPTALNFLPFCRACGYSLIEVLIAGGILAIGIAGAALMANAILVQEQSNGYSLRAFNVQEQAARLWQLGLDPTNITNILPERCSASNPPPANSIYLEFNQTNTTISGASIEKLNPLRIVFHSGTRGDGTLVFRTNPIIVVRPTIR